MLTIIITVQHLPTSIILINNTYYKGKGGASQDWFIQTYQSRGLLFDRILAWEVEIQTPAKIFDAMPLKILGRTSYYNIPASKVFNILNHHYYHHFRSPVLLLT